MRRCAWLLLVASMRNSLAISRQGATAGRLRRRCALVRHRGEKNDIGGIMLIAAIPCRNIDRHELSAPTSSVL